MKVSNIFKVLTIALLVIALTILAVSIIALSGCLDTDNYVAKEEYSQLEEALNNTIEEYSSITVERNNLKSKVYGLESSLNSANKEKDKYRNLLNNLNDLLDNVYYGYAENENYKSEGFNVFSMRYRDKIFLITAGHCIHYNFEDLDTGLYTTIRIRQNNNDWIYPELLTYENDYENNRDYALLYSDKIKDGLDFDLNNTYPEYVLGNEDNNIFKKFDKYNLIEGESGSPVIDIDGETIGIATGEFVDIDLVIEAIDNLE